MRTVSLRTKVKNALDEARILVLGTQVLLVASEHAQLARLHEREFVGTAVDKPLNHAPTLVPWQIAQSEHKLVRHVALVIRKLNVHIRAIARPPTRAVALQLLKINLPSSLVVVFGKLSEPICLG